MGRSLKKGPFVEAKLLKAIDEMNAANEKKVIKIVFTPQHGTSSKIGQRLLKELGYEFEYV